MFIAKLFFRKKGLSESKFIFVVSVKKIFLIEDEEKLSIIENKAIKNNYYFSSTSSNRKAITFEDKIKKKTLNAATLIIYL